MIRSEILSESPWSKPSAADEANGGLPPIIGIGMAGSPPLPDKAGPLGYPGGWFEANPRMGTLGEVSLVEPPLLKNFPAKHPFVLNPNLFKRCFPPRLEWTDVAREDRRRRMAELGAVLAIAADVSDASGAESTAMPAAVGASGAAPDAVGASGAAPAVADLALAAAASASHLTRLLQAVFFEAHVKQQRVIEDRQLDEAALSLDAPSLAAIREAHAPFVFEGRAEIGHFVEVVEGEHAGKRGVISRDDKDSEPYKVTFADGEESGFLKPHLLRSSGLDEAAFNARVSELEAASTAQVREACASLPEAARMALAEVRDRVAHDALPLLSLLQTEPLQLQASHFSFQEYFAARSLCEEGTVLSGPPWQWTSWWANTLDIGEEMGEPFARGLLRAAGVEGDALDLSDKLGGDRVTVLRVVELFVSVLASIDVVVDEQAALSIARAARNCDRVAHLGLIRCKMSPSGAQEIAEYVAISKTLTSLRLDGNELDSRTAAVFAEVLKSETCVLTALDLSSNRIDGHYEVDSEISPRGLRSRDSLRFVSDVSGLRALASAISVNRTINSITLDQSGSSALPVRKLKGVEPIETLDLSGKRLGAASCIVIAHLIESNAVLNRIEYACSNIEPPALVPYAIARFIVRPCTIQRGPNSFQPSHASAQSSRQPP